MDLFANLALGFDTAFTLQNLLYCLIGCILGTLIGVLPGLGPIATIAMLLPATYALPPIAALIMLAGIYYGSQYGGSTTAILLNIPGETSSVVTAIDGYQMARNGRAGVALFTAGMGSFFAGCVATLVLAAFAAPLSQLAFKFGPAEYFSLMVLGLVGSIVLAHGSLLKAVAMVLLGLLLGLVGTDVNSGRERFTFDLPVLGDGIGFVVVAMGLFGMAEILANLEKKDDRKIGAVIGRLWPTREEFRKAAPASVRGTIIGSILGTLAFTLVSFLRAPSWIWPLVTFVVLWALYGFALPWVSRIAMVLVIGALVFESLSAGVSWSPYYKVHTASYVDKTVGPFTTIQVNGIPHQNVMDAQQRLKAEPMYERPYQRAVGNPLDDVLIVGAGTGTDVALSLVKGATHVDAVEIDPRIQQIGSPRDIYEHPVNRFVADFVGSTNFLDARVLAPECCFPQKVTYQLRARGTWVERMHRISAPATTKAMALVA